MTHYGDFTPSKTVMMYFNTASFADGSPITLGGTPAVSVYKNSDTESTAGVTLSVDYDSRTGMHKVLIDTSADGTFYAAGNDFAAVITTGTVGGTSVVGRIVGSFSLSNRSALRPTTADRTLDVTAAGEAGIDWANIGSPTTTVNLSGTTIATTQQVDVNTIKTQTVTCAAGVTVRAHIGFAAQPGAANGGVACLANAAISFASMECTGNFDTLGNFTVEGITTFEAVNMASLTTTGEVVIGDYLGITGHFEIGGDIAVGGDINVTTDFTVGGNFDVTGNWEAGAVTFTSLTTNITGNLSGSVGSVTGAVGSVTGNVGGNVTGSVGTVNALAANSITNTALATSAVTEITDAWQALTIANGKTYAQTMEFIVSAVGAGESSGAAGSGAYTWAVTDSNGSALFTIDSDGIGNRSNLVW